MRAAILLFVATTACAQDNDWVRQWERANRSRPENMPTIARIAPLAEPGIPLVVHGQVFQSDGVTPAANVVVFAYHTDRTGVYNNGPGWRLYGWARSGKDGRFEFRTIRPGSYPRGRNPAHIHVTIDGPGLPRRWTSEVEFLDDAYLTDSLRKESAARGKFGSIRPVAVRNGIQHVDYAIRVEEVGRF